MESFNSSLIFITLLATLSIGTVDGIAGGEMVEHSSINYVVSVQHNNHHICGGAIITNAHVFTAAQCFIDDNEKFIEGKFSILTGISKLSNGISNGIVSQVEKVFVPKEYKKKNVDGGITYKPVGDIALLKLTDNLRFGEYYILNSIDVPKRTHGHFPKLANSIGKVCGYGRETPVPREKYKVHKKRENNSEPYDQLKCAQTVILHKRTCRTRFVNTYIDDRHICSQVNPEGVYPGGTCEGDIGDPLVVNGILIGILFNHLDNCNERWLPSLYTMVSQFIHIFEIVVRGDFTTQLREADYQSNKVLEKVWTFEELVPKPNNPRKRKSQS